MADTIIEEVLENTIVQDVVTSNTITVNAAGTSVVETTTDSIVLTESASTTIVTEGIQGPQGIQGIPGPQGPAGGEEVPLAKQVDFVTETDIYIGEAAVGSLTSASMWRIKHTIIAVDGDVSVTWADGDDSFDNIWDDRLSLNYS